MGQIEYFPLQDGLSGTAKTLTDMAILVRTDAKTPQLRNLASNIVSSCPGHDFKCETSRLFEFVRDQVTFRKDPVGQERVQDSDTTLRNRVGDCDDKCVLLASLLGALGHRSRFIVIGDSVDKFRHVYLETVQPRMSLDPTPERAPAGWEAQAAHRWSYDIWPGGKPMIGAVRMPPVFTPVDIPLTPPGSQGPPGVSTVYALPTAYPDAPSPGADNDWVWWVAAAAGGVFLLSLLTRR